MKGGLSDEAGAGVGGAGVRSGAPGQWARLPEACGSVPRAGPLSQAAMEMMTGWWAGRKTPSIPTGYGGWETQ